MPIIEGNDLELTDKVTYTKSSEKERISPTKADRKIRNSSTNLASISNTDLFGASSSEETMSNSSTDEENEIFLRLGQPEPFFELPHNVPNMEAVCPSTHKAENLDITKSISSGSAADFTPPILDVDNEGVQVSVQEKNLEDVNVVVEIPCPSPSYDWNLDLSLSDSSESVADGTPREDEKVQKLEPEKNFKDFNIILKSGCSSPNTVEKLNLSLIDNSESIADSTPNGMNMDNEEIKLPEADFNLKDESSNFDRDCKSLNNVENLDFSLNQTSESVADMETDNEEVQVLEPYNKLDDDSDLFEKPCSSPNNPYNLNYSGNESSGSLADCLPSRVNEENEKIHERGSYRNPKNISAIQDDDDVILLAPDPSDLFLDEDDCSESPKTFKSNTNLRENGTDTVKSMACLISKAINVGKPAGAAGDPAKPVVRLPVKSRLGHRVLTPQNCHREASRPREKKFQLGYVEPQFSEDEEGLHENNHKLPQASVGLPHGPTFLELKQFYECRKKLVEDYKTKLDMMSEILESLLKNFSSFRDSKQIKDCVTYFKNELTTIHMDVNYLRKSSADVIRSFTFCLSNLHELALAASFLDGHDERESVEILKDLNFLAFRSGIVLHPGHPRLVDFLIRLGRFDVLLELFHFWSFVPGVKVQSSLLYKLFTFASQANNRDLQAIAADILAYQPPMRPQTKGESFQMIHYPKLKLPDLAALKTQMAFEIMNMIRSEDFQALTKTFLDIPVARIVKLKRFILGLLSCLFDENFRLSLPDDKKCEVSVTFITNVFRETNPFSLSNVQTFFLAQFVSTFLACLQWTPHKIHLSTLCNVSVEFGLRPWDFDPIDHPTGLTSVSKEVVLLICADLKIKTSPMESFSLLMTRNLGDFPKDRLIQTSINIMFGLLKLKSPKDTKITGLQSAIRLFRQIYDIICESEGILLNQSFEMQEFDRIFSLIILEGLKYSTDQMRDNFMSAVFNFYSWAKGKFEFQVEGPLRGLVVKFKKCNRREEAGEVFQAGQRSNFYSCCHLSDKALRIIIFPHMTSPEIDVALDESMSQIKEFEANGWKITIEVVSVMKGKLCHTGLSFLDITLLSSPEDAIRRIRTCCLSFFELPESDIFDQIDVLNRKLIIKEEVVARYLEKSI